MTKVQSTSLEAYDVLKPDLGRRQREIYETIQKHGPISINDIGRIKKIGVNQVTGRLMELREKGLVYNSGFKFDLITRKRNLIWRVVR